MFVSNGTIVDIIVNHGRKTFQNIRFDQSSEESGDSSQPFYSVERQISPLGFCTKENSIPGKSKINHESVVELTTMPVGSKLSSLMLSSDDCQFVDSFVALSLSNDGESVEVKYILKRVKYTFISKHLGNLHNFFFVKRNSKTVSSNAMILCKISYPGVK
jgi:hypothetical protein